MKPDEVLHNYVKILLKIIIDVCAVCLEIISKLPERCCDGLRDLISMEFSESSV